MQHVIYIYIKLDTANIIVYAKIPTVLNARNNQKYLLIIWQVLIFQAVNSLAPPTCDNILTSYRILSWAPTVSLLWVWCECHRTSPVSVWWLCVIRSLPVGPFRFFSSGTHIIADAVTSQRLGRFTLSHVPSNHLCWYLCNGMIIGPLGTSGHFCRSHNCLRTQ